MSEKNQKISREEMADRFIELANEFSKTESKERISAAIMFAASRYNAYEISSKTDDLQKDRESALNWFSKQYKTMLEANIDELIEMHN